MARVAIGMLLEHRHHQRVLRSATVASASATGARVGSRDGMPISNSAVAGFRVAGDRQRAQSPAAAPRSSS